MRSLSIYLLSADEVRHFDGNFVSVFEIKDDIWAAHLAVMGSLSSKNWGVKYLLCVLHVFSKCTWFKPLKDQKAKTVLNGFIEIIIIYYYYFI